MQAEELLSPRLPTVASMQSNQAEIDAKLSLRPKVRRLSNSSSILSDIFRHPNVHEGALRRKIKESNNRRDPPNLVDFLRNTKPPPENFMSIPDDYGSPPSEEDDGWRLGVFSMFRKKKKKIETRAAATTKQPRPPQPKLIKLPDSAVAGRTTEGYRHIAISIPIEHAHVDAKTQPKNSKPASRAGNEPPASRGPEPRTGPPSANMELEAAMVPKSVESNEPLETLSRAAASALEESLMKDVPLDEPKSTSKTPLEEVPEEEDTAPWARNPRHIRTADPWLVRDAAATSPGVSAFAHVRKPSSSSNRPSSPVNICFPLRRSSLGKCSIEDLESLDSVPILRHRRELSSESNVSRGRSHRLSITESLATDDTGPVIIRDAVTARGYEPSSNNRLSVLTNTETIVYAPVAGTSRRQTISSIADLSAAPAETQKAGERTLSFSAYSQPIPRQEPAKGAKGGEGGGISMTGVLDLNPADSPADPGPERADTPVSLVETMVDSLPPGPSTGHSLRCTPVMVVADVEPSPLSASPPPSRSGGPRPVKTETKAPSSSLTTAAKRSPFGPLLGRPGSCGPTPPESPQHTESDSNLPPIPARSRPLKVPHDRVSLARRREWAARKEPQRAEAEACAEAAVHRRSELGPRPHGDGDGDDNNDDNGQDRNENENREEDNGSSKRNIPRPNSHQELAHRYAAVQEAREREIEARLLRLQKSGDAWVAAMGPLFERLNKSLMRAYNKDDDDDVGYDEHAGHAAGDYRTRDEHRRRSGSRHGREEHGRSHDHHEREHSRSRPTGSRAGGRDHPQPTWEQLKMQELAHDYNWQQERERRKARKRAERAAREHDLELPGGGGGGGGAPGLLLPEGADEALRPHAHRDDALATRSIRTARSHRTFDRQQPEQQQYGPVAAAAAGMLRTSARTMNTRTTSSGRRDKSSSSSTPLQAEWEAQLASQRRIDEKNAEVDARIAALHREAEQQQQQQHRRRTTRQEQRREREYGKQRAYKRSSSSHRAVDHPGELAEELAEPLGTGLDGLEPLMRELVGGSGLHFEGKAGRDDRLEEVDEGSEYLFDEF